MENVATMDIDGSLLEGGGQILRIAAALSTLLKKPINVRSIRANRSSAGLRPQHLTGLNLTRDISSGKLHGAAVGSTEIKLSPNKIKAGEYIYDTGTAGSVTLLFQIALPVLTFAPGKSVLRLRGGTNVMMCPQIDCVLNMKRIFELMNVNFNCNVVKRGYFPKGGGEVIFEIDPVRHFINPIELLNPGNLVEITGYSYVAGVLPIRVASMMAAGAKGQLQSAFPKISVNIDVRKENERTAVGNGSGIILLAKTDTGCVFGASELGKRGADSNEVGKSAANRLIEDIRAGGCVDRFLQDQLIIFMALAKGISRMKTGPVTLHTETAIHVTKLMCQAKFTITKETGNGDVNIIECEGIGLNSSN